MSSGKKTKKTSASSGSASSPSDPTAKPKLQSAKDKHNAADAVVNVNIANSMTALAQEAIHVSKTPTRLEDNEKAWQVTQAKLKVVNDSQREEQRALTAKQQAEATDKETAEYTDDQLLGDPNYKTGLGRDAFTFYLSTFPFPLSEATRARRRCTRADSGIRDGSWVRG